MVNQEKEDTVSLVPKKQEVTPVTQRKQSFPWPLPVHRVSHSRFLLDRAEWPNTHSLKDKPLVMVFIKPLCIMSLDGIQSHSIKMHEHFAGD